MISEIVSYFKSYELTISEDTALNLSAKLKFFQVSPVLGRFFCSGFLDYFYCEVLCNNSILEVQSSLKGRFHASEGVGKIERNSMAFDIRQY